MAQHSEAYDAIMARLAGGGRVVLDGGVGTEAQRRGVPLRAWAALANVEYPEVLLALHADYIEAGADVISANTFGCSDARLRESGMPGREEELNHAAVALALRARAQADAGKPVLVAGSMTTVGHRGPDGNTMSAPEDEQSLVSQAGALAARRRRPDHRRDVGERSPRKRSAGRCGVGVRSPVGGLFMQAERRGRSYAAGRTVGTFRGLPPQNRSDEGRCGDGDAHVSSGCRPCARCAAQRMVRPGGRLSPRRTMGAPRLGVRPRLHAGGARFECG